jgi:UDP-N-acetylmuramate dehydrogenase
MHTLAHNWFGLENLSLIPGTVGAAPVQNIGAYGVDVSHFIDAVSVYDIEQQCFTDFSNDMCKFGYRDSIFKRQYQANDQVNGQVNEPSQNCPSASLLITQVHFKLLKKPNINVSYKPINDELIRLGMTNPTPNKIAEIIIAIRQSKLPNPDLIPNAGSFFKNPVIPKRHYEMLLLTFSELISFHHDEAHVKLAAGQLIELSGFKGKRIGNASMYAQQALVLTNCGNATGRELWEYANLVSAAVLHKFSVNLTPEPLILINPSL